MSAPNVTNAESKKGRKPLVVNQEVIQTRFDKLANAFGEIAQSETVLSIVLSSGIPAEHTASVRKQFASAKSGNNTEAWKQFGFLMSRMMTKVSRQSDDQQFSDIQYDTIEKLLPIILELYGNGDSVEDDSEDDE